VTPVLAIPCINRPDLLAKTIASIDIPVRLLIIDNSGQGITHDVLPEDAWLIEPPANLGYPASVNLAIKCYPAEPYWLFANADVEFAPGDLGRLQTADMGWVGITDWRVFKLTAETVQRVGFFDENFHPAFCEDADYERRCTLVGVRWGHIPGDTTHVRSVSLEDHRADNARSYPSNVRRYVEKWGGMLRGGEGFTTPFDGGGSVAEGTQPELSRLRANRWHRADGGP
jgi:GT2 family glycosyltransferase